MNNNPKREEKYVWGCDESMCVSVNDKEASNQNRDCIAAIIK